MTQPITTKRAVRHHDLDAVFNFIVQYKRDHDGNSPSIREIAKQFEVSTSVASDFVDRLSRKGLVYSDFNTARGIRVVGGQWSLTGENL